MTGPKLLPPMAPHVAASVAVGEPPARASRPGAEGLQGRGPGSRGPSAELLTDGLDFAKPFVIRTIYSCRCRRAGPQKSRGPCDVGSATTHLIQRMATADQVKALIKSHAEGDDDRFYAVALQLATREARSGHPAYAQELKNFADSARVRPTSRRPGPVPVATPRGELAGLLSVVYPEDRLADLVLDPSVREQLDRVLFE